MPDLVDVVHPTRVEFWKEASDRILQLLQGPIVTETALAEVGGILEVLRYDYGNQENAVEDFDPSSGETGEQRTRRIIAASAHGY